MKDNTKHTPGPWKTVGDYVSDTRSPLRCVAKVTSDTEPGDPLAWPGDYQEAEANRRLIAAAPEMFEALETLVSYWNQDEDLLCEDALAAAQIAIRKAAGE